MKPLREKYGFTDEKIDELFSEKVSRLERDG
jgi:hypothetical protein